MSPYPPSQVPPADPPILFLVGPTAVGKSALALHLAQRFGGEIVNADSRQIYRHMDIGTSKPSPEDRAKVPHHLVDILDPDQESSLALFLETARKSMGDIRNRGGLPSVVGGTGQYVWAILEGWQVPRIPPDPQLRQELEAKAEAEGVEALHRELLEVDPVSASRIHPRNLRRVIRALEIYQQTGLAPSMVRRKEPPTDRPLIIGLTVNRQELYSRIDRRVDDMLKSGLVEEVQDLLQMGYSPELPSMSSMGYKEIARCLNGELTLAEASERIKYETHRLARHQYAWFRLKDPRIHWLEAGPNISQEADELVSEFLKRAFPCGKITSATEEQSQ